MHRSELDAACPPAYSKQRHDAAKMEDAGLAGQTLSGNHLPLYVPAFELAGISLVARLQAAHSTAGWDGVFVVAEKPFC